ncbi:M28 family metallopeptidase [Salinimicrobium sp. TH3]|uniref:M28 family metallopeptidase n=1 Tax=Salinimicrobium sp. TH3 TaxID=2997342 RepID=UPI0022749BD5|nr:M20/M25/M40 family metallo-hydrolase [Salinimicrobium sp. TH3]MCY2688292.1 M20/M25/M40 family metallo-hydrolase [Salinimicrobium sp. TH3]
MEKFHLSGIWGLGFFVLFGCGQTQKITGNPEPGTVTKTESYTQMAVEEAITQDGISSILKYLSSDELKGRKTGSEGIDKAADYIQTVLRKSGVKPFFETYRDSFQVKDMTGYNVVGFVEGTDPGLKDEYIIIGAHYDHVGIVEPVEGDSIANGANDNAAGTTAVLELAAYFAENPPKRSILFTLFSAEELGLVGAKHLAERLEKEAIDLYVMFNIEMVGIPMLDKDYLVYLTGYERSNLAEKFNLYSNNQVLGFLPQAKEYQLFKRSDNYPFFERFNVPAQTISSFDFTNYEYYHHVNDEFEEMDLDHLENVIESLIPGLTAMANSPEKEIKMHTK